MTRVSRGWQGREAVSQQLFWHLKVVQKGDVFGNLKCLQWFLIEQNVDLWLQSHKFKFIFATNVYIMCVKGLIIKNSWVLDFKMVMCDQENGGSYHQQALVWHQRQQCWLTHPGPLLRMRRLLCGVADWAGPFFPTVFGRKAPAPEDGRIFISRSRGCGVLLTGLRA